MKKKKVREQSEVPSHHPHGSNDNPVNSEQGKINAFLGATAFVAATATASYALNRPEVDLVLPSDENIDEFPVEEWIATSCLNCTTRCATSVRVVNGKAVRIASNRLSKFSDGETCPRSHIGLQVLYDPDRFTGPMMRTNTQKGRGVDPGWTSISWDQALNQISNRLQSIRAQGNGEPHKLLLMHGLNTVSDEDLIKRFASAYGTPNVISHEALENEAESAGGWMADGHYTPTAYDLEHTNYILSFGAGIVESQKPLSRNLRMWGKIRRERPNRAKIVVVDPRYSVTAAKSDQWIPINPGTDGSLAMAIANVIISEGLYDSDFIQNWTTGFDEYRELALRHNSPELASEITGIDAEAIRRLSREFASATPSIAWRGRGATCWPNGSYTSYAIYCLNALVGSIDVPGGVIYQEYPEYRDMPGVIEDSIAKAGKSQSVIDLRGNGTFPAANVVTNQVADSILADSPYQVDIAVGFNCNFNMVAPGTGRWDKAMQKLPYYIHVAPAMTEMAQYADIILPASTFLEEWGYEHCPPGPGFAEAKIKQPVVEPLNNSRATADIIFDLANRLGGTVAQSFAGIGDTPEGFVRYRTEQFVNWTQFREEGVWIGASYQYRKYDAIFDTPSGKFEFRSGNLEKLLDEAGINGSDLQSVMPDYRPVDTLGDKVEYPLSLVTYHPVMDIRNGDQNYPWAQEIFMVMHGQGWNNYIELNSDTAREHKISDGDKVWVESQFGRIKAKARVFQGIHPHVVAIANGQGHWSAGRWADGIGVNPNDIIGVDYDTISGQSCFFNTRVRVYKA